MSMGDMKDMSAYKEIIAIAERAIEVEQYDDAISAPKAAKALLALDDDELLDMDHGDDLALRLFRLYVRHFYGSFARCITDDVIQSIVEDDADDRTTEHAANLEHATEFADRAAAIVKALKLKR